jgi:hypothetical protein
MRHFKNHKRIEQDLISFIEKIIHKSMASGHRRRFPRRPFHQHKRELEGKQTCRIRRRA